MHSKFQLNIQIRPAVTNIQYDRGAHIYSKSMIPIKKLLFAPSSFPPCRAHTFFALGLLSSCLRILYTSINDSMCLGGRLLSYARLMVMKKHTAKKKSP